MKNGIDLSITLLCILLAVITRGQHAPGGIILPDASWAALFLLGLNFRTHWAFFGLCALFWAVDFYALRFTPSADFCISPAYGFLLPAYGALWYAGRIYARYHMPSLRTLFPLVVTMTGGAMLCEILSSGGFYFFSGRFSEPVMSDFGTRLLTYFPDNARTFYAYVVVALLARAIALILAHGVPLRSRKTKSSM